MTNAYDKATELLTSDLETIEPALNERQLTLLTVGLIARGWTRVDLVTRFPGDYTVGRKVEIIDSSQSADWIPADVSGSVGGTVQVDTARGPRTIGSARLIRPVF